VQYTAGIPSSSGLGIEKGISEHCFVYTLLSGSRSAHRAVVVVWYDLSASCYLCSTHAGWAEPCMCLNMNLQKLGLLGRPRSSAAWQAPIIGRCCLGSYVCIRAIIASAEAAVMVEAPAVHTPWGA
jgi:hypothetical protein